MADGTTTTTTNSSLPGYVEPYVSDLFSRAQALTADNPAPSYTGPRVAGLTPMQQQAGTSVSGLNAGNLMSQGAGSIGAGSNYTPSTSSFGLAAAQQYMSPYQQGVTDIAKREATRDDQIAQTGRDSAAARAGAFGGSRQGVIEAEADRNLGQRLSDIQTQGLNTSWQQAQQQFNADTTRQQQDRQFGSQAAIKGGEAMADLGKTALGLQSTAGLLDQQTQQKGLDTGYNDWLNQQQHPYDQLTFMRNMVSGFPGSTSTQTQQSSPTSNWASDLAGVGSALGGLGSLFDLWAGGGHIPERGSVGGLGAGRVAQLYGSLS
jgi:hypothetical protein